MKGLPQLRKSLLDLLVDHDAEASIEPAPSPSASLASASDAVLRDLENLLNTRRPHRRISHDRDHPSADCILAYGTTDFSSVNPGSYAVRQKISREIEALLLRFEPRLQSPTVRVEEGAEADRSLRFIVEAVLRTEPVAAPITFSTRFDANRGAYLVSL